MLVPINQEEEYAERAQLFASMSDQELLDDYNRVHASPGIVGSKLRYLSQLNEVIESRGLPTPKQHISLSKTIFKK
ncbi:MAG: hypothetical protein ACKO7B_04700 [Flavobacteriales bacterium]